MNESVTISIFKTHINRLGIIRVVIGSFFMYTTFPLFLMIHITITIICYKLFLQPLLSLPYLNPKKYIVLDRFNVDGLGWFDRLNCLFCDYANGVTLLFHEEIDQVANSTKKISFLKKVFIIILIIPLTLFFVLGMLIGSIPTKFIVSALGFHRASVRRIKQEIIENNYASQHPPLAWKIIRLYKINAKILFYNLEQIESAWCPIKHLEREGRVFPVQHTNFIDSTNLDRVKEILKERGTLSKKLPKIQGSKGDSEQN